MSQPVALVAFFFGLVVGSFLNVCIYRLPRGESLVRPASRCPACLARIKPLDNVPILGFLLLRGKCRACGARISWRYPVVETLTGFLFALTVGWFGLRLNTLPLLLFLSILVVVSFIDLEHQVIPHALTLPMIPVGLLFSLLLREPPFVDAIAGAFAGAGLLYFVAVYGEVLLKKESMGGGDVNLLAMIGAFLGWRKALLTLFLGCLSGSVVGGAVLVGQRVWKGAATETQLQGNKPVDATRIPFGPFLALGAAIALFFGEGLIVWYTKLLR